MTRLKILMMHLFFVVLITSCENETKQKKTKSNEFFFVEQGFDFDNSMKTNTIKKEKFILKENDLLLVNVDSSGACRVNARLINIDSLCLKIKNYYRGGNIVSYKTESFKFLGDIKYPNKLIILVGYDAHLSYKKYTSVRDKIFDTYNSMKNELSLKMFNKTLHELFISESIDDKVKIEELEKIFEIRYSENRIVKRGFFNI